MTSNDPDSDTNIFQSQNINTGLVFVSSFFVFCASVGLYGRLLVVLHSLCARRVKCSVKQTRARFLHLVPLAESSLQISGRGFRLYNTEKRRNVGKKMPLRFP